ncbi:MAG: MATE family efflux transporter [Bacteroides sp.]
MNVYKQHINKLLKIGVPIMIGQAGAIILSFADNIMVGRYGIQELAASAFANNIINLFIFISIGFSCGLTPIIGELFGKKDQKSIGQAVKNSLYINLLLAVLLLLVMGIIYFQIDRFGQPEELLPLIRPYFITVAISTLFVMMFNTLKQFTDGICQPKVSTIILITGNLLNIIGNYGLIYGKLGCPELGLFGAGLSTLISRVLMVIIFYAYLRHASKFKVYVEAFKTSKLNPDCQKKLFHIGYPLAAQMGMESAAFALSAVMVGWLGTTALAGHQVTMTISQICFMLYTGMGSAITILVSNAHGQGDRINVRRLAYTGYGLIFGLSIVTCGLIYLFESPIIHLFTSSEEVADLVTMLLIPMGIFQLGDGIQIAFSNSLRGIQDVKPIMWIALFSYFVVSLPASYFFGFYLHWGVSGIWYGFPLGLTTAGIFFYIRFKRQIATENESCETESVTLQKTIHV